MITLDSIPLNKISPLHSPLSSHVDIKDMHFISLASPLISAVTFLSWQDEGSTFLQMGASLEQQIVCMFKVGLSVSLYLSLHLCQAPSMVSRENSLNSFVKPLWRDVNGLHPWIKEMEKCGHWIIREAIWNLMIRIGNIQVYLPWAECKLALITFLHLFNWRTFEGVKVAEGEAGGCTF